MTSFAAYKTTDDTQNNNDMAAVILNFMVVPFGVILQILSVNSSKV
ncbi:MAG: hypothetical protein ACYC1M_01845 [Armatimonadota bacterium]